jgi:radical SAM superfamily enzyme YgiQ (UPF0313 family)
VAAGKGNTCDIDMSRQLDPVRIREIAWHLGYGFFSLEGQDLSAAVLKLLPIIETLDRQDAIWTLAPLRDAFHALNDQAAIALVEVWVDVATRFPEEIDNAITSIVRFSATGSDRVRRHVHRLLQQFAEDAHPLGRGLQAVLMPNALPPINKGHRSAEPAEVVLVVPRFLSGKSFLQPPLDMLLAATALREVGYEPILYDLRAVPVDLEILCEKVRGAKLVVVCTTPYDQVQTYYVDYRLADALATIKRLADAGSTKVAVTGSHGSIHPALMFRSTRCDFIIRGEVEEAVVKLAKHLIDGERLADRNVIQSGEECSQPRPGDFDRIGRATDLDRIPSYDLIDFSNYFGDGYREGHPYRKARAGAVLATRGCPFSCSFCFNYWGTKVRKRSVDSVIAELQRLELDHRVATVFFIDFSFTVDRRWVQAFCEAYWRAGLRITWSCETRPDLVDDETLKAMARSGCTEVWLGAESFNGAVIDRSRKEFEIGQTVEAISRIRASGMAAHNFIVLGLPGETVQTLNHTIRSLWHLKTPYTHSVIIATPRIGTQYFELARTYYPERDLLSSYFAVSPIKGLVDNEMSPYLLQEAVALLATRQNIFDSETPPVLAGARTETHSG